MEKVLVFGGTFDPPHNEHVRIALFALNYLGLSKLVVVPTYLPAYKRNSLLSFEDRVELTKLAFAGEDKVVVDEIEKMREKDNYAALVLPELKKKYGEITYMIGGDSLDYFDEWYMPKKILDTCEIAVVPRAGREKFCGEKLEKKIEELKSKFGGKFSILPILGGDVSSTRVRAQMAFSCFDDVPEGVAEYIEKNKLYADFHEMVKKVRCFEDDALFEHTKAVVMTALDLNSDFRMGFAFDKVFTAALLHDNAKQRKFLDGLSVPVDAIGSPVLHQFLGAQKAKRDFGVDDEEVLSAIACHTSAKKNMSEFEKLIYTADSVSYDRTYEPIPKLREKVFENFEAGFKAVLEYTYKKVDKNKMYPLTEQAYEYYIKNDRK